MRRRAKLQPAHNRERWLISYADFITLLFAFFTTLYAISVVDAQKAQRLVHSIQESFGSALFEAGSDQPGVLREPVGRLVPLGQQTGIGTNGAEDGRRLDALRDRAEALARRLEERDALRVSSTERGLVISLSDSLFFEQGGATIPPRAGGVLEQVARELAPLPNHVRVEGHTDDVPVSGGAIGSNWHLSAARAANVVVAFERAGVPAFRLSASGFADQRPLVSNGSPDGRRLNRRVDVVVLRARPSVDDD